MTNDVRHLTPKVSPSVSQVSPGDTSESVSRVSPLYKGRHGDTSERPGQSVLAPTPKNGGGRHLERSAELELSPTHSTLLPAPETAPAAPPTTPPHTVVVATGGPELRPCAVCRVVGPIDFDTPDSYWPWVHATRICRPCLHRIDHPDDRRIDT